MKLGIYTASTLNHSYALKAQARALHSACIYAKIKKPVIVVVCSNDDFFDEVEYEYEYLFNGKAKVIIIKKDEFFDCEKRKKYKNEVQLMISKMRTIATKRLLVEGCDRILSMDSDVIPKHNSIRCMLDTLKFDNGYYGVAQCPYPSQGGGSFLGGRGTPEKPIAADFSEEERNIPKELKEKRKKAVSDLKKFVEELQKKQTPKNQKTDKQIKSKQEKLAKLEREISSCPPKMNVFSANGKKWKKRGWFDYAYPAIGKGSVVPVDWVGFGCTMMTRETAAMCDFSGYDGSGTEDLFIIWNRWYQNDVKIANISHCPSDHIVRDRNNNKKYIHIITYHEHSGECEGHLRQKNKPWYGQDIEEKFDPLNNGEHSEKEKNKKEEEEEEILPLNFKMGDVIPS